MLIGKDVIMRPIQFEDWEKTLIWRNDMFIKSSTMSHPFPITSEQEQTWYKEKISSKSNDYLPFSIINKANNELIGYMSLNAINWINRNCFIGGAIGEKANIGKGLGKEALELLIAYAFESLNLKKVYGYVLSDHPALKTWIKIGAVIEGTLIEHCFSGGAYRDVKIIAWRSK